MELNPGYLLKSFLLSSPLDFNENALIKIIQPIVYRECDVKDKYLPIAASAAWDKCPSCISTCTAKLPWLLYIATMYVRVLGGVN